MPGAAKKDGLHPGREKRNGRILRRQNRTAAQSQFGIDDGRVVENELLCAAGRAVIALIDQSERLFNQSLSVFLRVCYGGRAANELGLAAIKFTDAAQAAQQIGHMAAEDAAIGVDLIQYHKGQVAEQAAPTSVVGQDSGVEHVGIGDQDAALLPYFAALALRSVAVVAVDSKGQTAVGNQGFRFGLLVVGQRLGREKVESTARRLVQQASQHGDGIPQRLAGRGGRRQHNVLAAQGRLNGPDLVGIQGKLAAHSQRIL